MTSATSADDKNIAPSVPTEPDASGKSCRFLHQHFVLIRPLHLLFLMPGGTSRLKSEGCISGSQKKQAEYSVRQPGKMHIQLGIVKIMHAVKNVASRHIRWMSSRQAWRASQASPISRASLRAKFSSPSKTFPQKNHHQSARYFSPLR